jgi:hypothetical protein
MTACFVGFSYISLLHQALQSAVNRGGSLSKDRSGVSNVARKVARRGETPSKTRRAASDTD